MKIKLIIPVCFLLIAIMGIGFASAADTNNNTQSIEEPQFMELLDNSSNVIVDSSTPVNINNDKDMNSSATYSNSTVNSISHTNISNNFPHGSKKAPEIKCLNTKLPETENEVQKYSEMLNLKQEIKDSFDLIIEVYSTHSLSDTLKICADVLTLNEYNNKAYTIKDIRIMMMDMMKGVCSSEVRDKLIDIHMKHTNRPETDSWFDTALIILWPKKAIELGLLV